MQNIKKIILGQTPGFLQNTKIILGQVHDFNKIDDNDSDDNDSDDIAPDRNEIDDIVREVPDQHKSTILSFLNRRLIGDIICAPSLPKGQLMSTVLKGNRGYSNTAIRYAW